jgi:uncharacterized SAM-binding protein YcdF (DUF218 family)
VIIAFLKQHAHMDSPMIVVGVLAVVVVWLWRRPDARGPRRLLVAFVAAYWLMATPVGAALLTYSVAHGLTSVRDRESARGADTVVVLGGGAGTFSEAGTVLGFLTSGSLLRVLEAARVYKTIDARLMIVSGGFSLPGYQLKPESEMLRDALVQAGVPPDHIEQDSSARTTREHPQTIGPILERHHVGRFVLVTSPAHMRRALAVFHAAGFDPVPSVSPVRSEDHPPPSWLIPTQTSLEQSDQAVYEYGAWMYYQLGGWN